MVVGGHTYFGISDLINTLYLIISDWIILLKRKIEKMGEWLDNLILIHIISKMSITQRNLELDSDGKLYWTKLSQMYLSENHHEMVLFTLT